MSNLSGSGTLRGSLSRGGGAPSDVYWDDILDKPEFATVATSGSYNDLLDKPTIPPAPTVMIGATTQSNGVAGYVTQPLAGDQDKFLNGGGQWVTPPSNSINYSTNEQVIGVWIDNKPLYAKTISHDTAMTNRAWTQLINDSNITIKMFDGYIYLDGQSYTQINYHRGSTATEYSCGVIFNNEHGFQVYPSIDGATITCKVTLYYTKTTDTIGG